MSHRWQRLWKHHDGEPRAIAWAIATISLALPVVGLLMALAGGLAVYRGHSLGWLLLGAGIATIVLDVVIDVVWAGAGATGSDLPHLNRRGDQLTGRIAIVAERIEGGRGRVRLGDTLWAVEGPDCPTGSLVRVTASRATVLLVEPAEPAGREGGDRDASQPRPCTGR